MRTRFLLFTVLLVALLCGAAYGEVKVCFSPDGGFNEAIIRVARSAQTQLCAACYTFSLDPLADELVAAKKRGVSVRVILDREQTGKGGLAVARFVDAGIPVKVNSHDGLMHDNFLVADGKSVATGSFDWTPAAIEKNDENLVVFLDEVGVVSAFAAQFDKMWNDSTRFTAFSAAGGTAGAAAIQPAASARAGPDTVYITKTGTKYHRAGCRHLAKSSISISRKDAIARGYTPCKVCRP